MLHSQAQIEQRVSVDAELLGIAERPRRLALVAYVCTDERGSVAVDRPGVANFNNLKLTLYPRSDGCQFNAW
jgi:hypothetical protein